MRIRNDNLYFGKKSQFRMLRSETEACPKCGQKLLCNLEGELVETADPWRRTQAEQNLRPSRTRIVSPLMKHRCGR